MKPQTLIMLVVALGCGLAAMVMTQRFLAAPASEKPQGTLVIVAAAEIKPGEKINDTLIKTAEWPQEVVPPNAITNIDDVVGRSVRYPIGANEVITAAKLAAKGIGPGLDPIIENGQRAMSVPIKTHESAAGFIKPGSRVDVVMIAKRIGTEGGKAKTILQNLRVIAVNHSITNDPEENEKGTVVEMVTFLLTPEEAETLALAQNSGSIQLVLRSPLEDEYVKTKGVTQEELLRGNAKFSEAEKKPVDGQKLAADPGALTGFLAKLISNKEGEKAEPNATPTPVVQFAPPPPERKKRLVYRDLQGNVLMEVLLDAEDKVVENLEGLLEDVEPEDGLASATQAYLTPPPAAKAAGGPEKLQQPDEHAPAESSAGEEGT